MSIELARRELVGGTTDLSSFSEEDKKRALELSAYFTVPAIEPQHQTLALFTAMNFAQKNKQLSSALGFANALIEKGTNARFKESVSVDVGQYNMQTTTWQLTNIQAKKIKAICERQPGDQTEIEYDNVGEFDICSASFTPIYPNEPSSSCPYTGAKYHARYKGTVCRVCNVCSTLMHIQSTSSTPSDLCWWWRFETTGGRNRCDMDGDR